jgi:hypothetical protein
VIWLALGVIGFIAHPIQTIKAIFESWHAGQHANETTRIIVKSHEKLTEEQAAQMRQHFLDHYKNRGWHAR